MALELGNEPTTQQRGLGSLWRVMSAGCERFVATGCNQVSFFHHISPLRGQIVHKRASPSLGVMPAWWFVPLFLYKVPGPFAGQCV